MTELAIVVAASSAFPPVLSPLVMDEPDSAYEPESGDDLQKPPYTTRVVLTDGGVYDNLGLETAWGFECVLISDGGGQMAPQPRPHAVWPVQLKRVLSVVDNQVRSLRKRQAVGAFEAGLRRGTYWGIRTNIADYKLADALPAPHARTIELAKIATRLNRLPTAQRRQLVNWGYAVCDAAMRSSVLDEPALPPEAFPFPDAGVGP